MRIRARKYWLVSTILATAWASLPFDGAYASIPFPTSKCSKAGQISNATKVSFKCTLVNNRLIWVALTKVPLNPVKPSPSLSLQQSKSIPSVLETVNKSLSALLPTTALSSIDDSVTGTIIAEPGLPAGDITQTRRVLKQIYLAQPIFHLTNPPIAILAKSENFIKSQFHQYCNEPITWYPNQTTTMENWQGWAFVGCLHSTPVQVVPLPPTGVPIDHIESALGSDLGYLPIGINDNIQKLPTWFVRGLKGVIGEYAMSIGDTSWHVPYMGVENCLSAKLSDISYSYVELNKNRCEVLGAAASRYMVSLKGLTPTIAFINELQATGVWSEQIFSDFLGMPFAQFERDVKEYAKALPKH